MVKKGMIRKDNKVKKGVIRKSTSPWSAPAHSVPKKNLGREAKMSLLRRYSRVEQGNKVRLPSSSPTRRLCIISSGSQYFSALHCRSGFWHATIRREVNGPLGMLRVQQNPLSII